MRFEVRPGDGIGMLRFGMLRKEARKRLGEPDETHEWEDVEETQDFWLDDGLSGLYDGEGGLVEIMVLPPAGAAVDGVSLLGLEPAAAAEALRSLDAGTEFGEQTGVGEHIVAPGLGLVIEMDEDEESDAVVSAQLIAVEPARMARLLTEDTE